MWKDAYLQDVACLLVFFPTSPRTHEKCAFPTSPRLTEMCIPDLAPNSSLSEITSFERGDKAGFMETVRQVAAANVRVPTASPFMFELTAEAAAHNSGILESFDYDLASAIDAGDYDQPRLRVETAGAARAALKPPDLAGVPRRQCCTGYIRRQTAGYKHTDPPGKHEKDIPPSCFDTDEEGGPQERTYVLCGTVFHLRRNERPKDESYRSPRHHIHDWKQNHHPAMHLADCVWNNFGD